jgi:uracil-DNA glycosylase family 4
VSATPAAEFGKLCRMTASLVREVRDSRWAGTERVRMERAASPAVPSVAPGWNTLAEVAEAVASCRRCPLHEKRTNTVFGEGDPAADLMFVGEGPGADEDRQGRPFVGKAGRLLDDIISKGMGLRREQVFIANVVKCRPPENRNPEPSEIAMCAPYLHAQIDFIRPKVIVALGKFAAQVLLDTGAPISKLRGRWSEYRGVRLMPTFHPAYLLRNPADKSLAWKDIQAVMSDLGLQPPAKG